MISEAQIPDKDNTYMRVHRINIDFNATDKRKMLLLSAFNPMGENLSVEWEEHTTPEQTRNRAKVPIRNGVVKMNAFEIRNGDFPLVLNHVPSIATDAHSEIIGVPPRKSTDVGIRAKLAKISQWVIDCAQYDE